MVHSRLSDVSQLVRTRMRDLPADATRAWGRVRSSVAAGQARAAAWIANRSGGRAEQIDPDSMTKDELMALARKEDVPGRSSMTKAQLAAALRKFRRN